MGREGAPSVCARGTEFSGWSKGGPVFFQWAKGGKGGVLSQGEGDHNFSAKPEARTRIFPGMQRGDQNFFYVSKGGGRKNW